MYKIKPLNNNITLKVIDNYNPDVLIQDQAVREFRWCEVLDVGPGFPDFNGIIEPPIVKPGDIVYVMAHGREMVNLSEIGGEDCYVASELDMMCILEDKETYKIKPLGVFVEVEKIDTPDTESTVVMLDSKKTPPCRAVVKSLGKGWKDVSGNPIDFQVEVGDIIVFDPHKPLVVHLESLGLNEKRYLVMHTDIYGILEKE